MSHPNHFTGSNLPTEGYPPFGAQPPLYAAPGVPPSFMPSPGHPGLLQGPQQSLVGAPLNQASFTPQKDKLESALDFLEQVKAVFENRLEVYNQFLDIMKEFKAHSIDTPGVIARVKELFKGHPKLIFGFNTFLPPGYKIDLAEVEAEEEQRKRLEQQKREASNAKGDNWDAQSAAAQKKYPEEFDQARNYVRKIKVRFEYQPHIYKAFLEILHTYHNKQHTIQEVYQQVARLFKDNPDLLEEFKQFLPDPANQKREAAAPASQPTTVAAVTNNNLQGPRGRSTRSNPPRSAIANQTAASAEPTRRPTRDRSARADDSSKSRVADGSYGTFTEHSYFFRIKSYLGPKRYPEFLKCLTLFNQEIITKYELVLLARDLLRGEYELLNWFKEFVGLEDEELSEDEGGFSLAELDLSNSEQCTPSYRALPEKYRVAKCSGRTRLCSSVLNDTWISVPIGSEDGTFKNSRKNQYEELLFKCEDDRYEFDLLIENNTSTIKALESLLRKIKTLAPEEINSYELNDKDELEQLQYKSIKKVYGTRGKEMVDSLKKYPAVAIPVVLARLKQKDIEWSKAKREWNKVWRQINERNYHKSLDHMGSFFKADEKKFLSAKSLLQDVAKAMDPTSSVPSQLNFEFKHPHIFDDIKRLMQVTFEKSIGRTDREKADKLVKQVFTELFSLNPRRAEDSASDVKPLNTAGAAANTPRIVFLGNDNHYLLFRYVQVLYQRLERAREMSSIPLNQTGNWSVMKDVENGNASNIVSIKTDEKMEVDSTRELAVGTTMLSNVPVVQPLDEEQTMQRYNKFMDELVKLISGAVEQGQFEDEARLALGTGSFMLFTLDKVVAYLCKQVHVVLGDQQAEQLLGLYSYEFVRTQEGTANEQVYINNAAQLLQNGRCYLFAFDVKRSGAAPTLHLTIEYISLDGGKATKVDVKPLPSNDNGGAGSGAGNSNNSNSGNNNSNAPSGPSNGSPSNSGGNSSPSGNGSMPPASTLSYNARELEQWSRYTNQLLLADHPHHIITHLFLNRNLKKNKKDVDKVFNNIQVHNDLGSMIDVRTLKPRYVEHTEDWFYRPKSAKRAAHAGTKRAFSPSLFNKMKS